ncbi:hypothetical protein BJX63DRAFT_53905 [Aspergillus granulosus]|uniref:Uncharacterized protein n=1 Tax=Aspergillus granulosus TaxID=176169 RepID=A0ABR4GXW4_9EURO
MQDYCDSLPTVIIVTPASVTSDKSACHSAVLKRDVLCTLELYSVILIYHGQGCVPRQPAHLSSAATIDLPAWTYWSLPRCATDN